MRTTTFVLFGIVLFLIAFLTGCDEEKPTAERKQTVQTNKLLTEINRQVGLPNITNFQQKKLMKMVFELCDKEDLICYAYIKSDYQGKLVFIGKCLGFGVPFSAQYTNPAKARASHAGWAYTIPQADPNGLYMPTSSSATWLMMIDPTTEEPRPVYLEPEIVVSPFPLVVE
jgi:hypothetical protein